MGDDKQAPAMLARLLAAALLTLGLAAGGWFVGQGLERFRAAERSVTVKGVAERDVKADFASWTLTFRRAGHEFGGVQRELAADRDRVVAFLQAQGLKPEEIEARPLQVEDLLAREYASERQPLRFNGAGRVVVHSPRVEAVAAAARATDPLIQAGVQLASEGEPGPRFQLRAFNDAKAPLLAEATRAAREQAQKFAAEAGATLGPLKSANQGVVQIGSLAGAEEDHAGSQIKRLRVVSTFEYLLR